MAVILYLRGLFCVLGVVVFVERRVGRVVCLYVSALVCSGCMIDFCVCVCFREAVVKNI